MESSLGRAYILAIGWIAASLLACSGEATPERATRAAQPHIVLLLADDLGWNDVGYHGSEIRTPRIDRLVREGVRLDQFYATPLCSATRAALLTGRHAHRYGLHSGFLSVWAQHGLPVEEVTLAERLRDAGYATAMLGKWHLGLTEHAYLPLQRGFDHHYGGYGGTIDYFEHTLRGGLDWHRNERPVREEGYATTLLGDEALRLIEAHDPEIPLFLYVAFNAPHRPLQAPEEEIDAYADIGYSQRRTFAAMVTVMDREVGRIVDALEERGMTRDTLLLFVSDNGGAPPVGGSNAPLRGRKGLVYEGGIRVPALARWPGRLEAGGVVREPIHVVDLHPTLLGLAGAAAEGPLPLDGVDVWPAIERGERLARDELLLYASPAGSALREESWKLVLAKRGPDEPETVELFDLAADPNESLDLGDAEPARRDRMRARLEVLRAEGVPVVLNPKRESGPDAVPEVWGPLDR
jgi:arylsulfatase A-like enzyme